MNLKLDFDFKKILPGLQKAQPYIAGIVLIGAFGYTAYVVNAALNVQPGTPTPVAPTAATGKIIFDKATISSVKSLEVVQGDVPVGGLGTHDPFR